MELRYKNIIITGASSGIGLELLLLFAKIPDVQIVAVARHIENIPEEVGVIYPYSSDVSKQQGVDAVFDYAHRTIGGVDLFIANAGFAYVETIEEPDWIHINDIFSLNVFSPIYALEKLLQENDRKTQCFVTTISCVGFISLPAYSLYCSTKAALRSFIEAYRYEMPSHIQITAVYPVATKTKFFDRASGQDRTPLPWPSQKADVVAAKILRGIIRGNRNVYPSFLFRIFYPLGRAFPFLLKIYSMIEGRKIFRWLNNQKQPY